jgi:DNA-binding LacI/PurR family transcriptional regulator
MEKQFPELDEAWFKTFGFVEANKAAAEWTTWTQGDHKRMASYKKALAVATGLTPGAIGHYVRGDAKKLSEQTWAKLDALSRVLGFAPTPRRTLGENINRAGRSERRVALLVELARVPSRPFHMEVIRSVLDGAATHNLSLSLHEAQPSNLAEEIERILRHYTLDGLILLRLTPDRRTAAVLKKWKMPTVLIHAHRLRYPCLPFIANVVPNQEQLGDWVRAWVLRELPGDSQQPRHLVTKIVMVAMPDENTPVDFEPIETGIEPAIRNKRKRAIIEALKDYPLVVETIEDYSFRHAYAIGRQHENASEWIALSDEVGVALKHVLLAADQSSSPRIIGFDDSDLARLEKITSIGQHVEQVGLMAVDALSSWFVNQTQDKVCEELTTDLQLTLRST